MKHIPIKFYRPDDGTMRGMEIPEDRALINDNGVCLGVLYGDIEEVRGAQNDIVKAVNNHDRLVEALENIIVNSTRGVCLYMVSDDVFHKAMNLLKEIKETK